MHGRAGVTVTLRAALPLLLCAGLAGCAKPAADADADATTAAGTAPHAPRATAGDAPAPAEAAPAGNDAGDVRCRDPHARRPPTPEEETLPVCTGAGAPPRAWFAEGGLDEFHGTGTICDLSKPFTIRGSGNTVTFVATGAGTGTYTYSGVMSGFGVRGEGTWSARVDAAGGTLTGTGEGCVETPVGARCAVDTERYTLTPAPSCGP